MFEVFVTKVRRAPPPPQVRMLSLAEDDTDMFVCTVHIKRCWTSCKENFFLSILIGRTGQSPLAHTSGQAGDLVNVSSDQIIPQ